VIRSPRIEPTKTAAKYGHSDCPDAAAADATASTKGGAGRNVPITMTASMVAATKTRASAHSGLRPTRSTAA